MRISSPVKDSVPASVVTPTPNTFDPTVSDDTVQAEVFRYQLRLSRRNALLFPVPLLLTIAFVAHIVDDGGAGHTVWLWALAFGLTNLLMPLQSLLAAKYVDAPLPMLRKLNLRFYAIALVAGTCGGALATFWLHQTDTAGRAYSTLVMGCLALMGVISAGGVPLRFVLYGLPLLGQFALFWLLQDFDGASVGVLLIFMFGFAVSFVFSNARVISEHIRARLGSELLLEELRRQHKITEATHQALSEAIQSRTRLFAAANHDLRQPLQALSLYAYILSKQAAGSMYAELAEKIMHGAQAMQKLFGGLLDIARIDACEVPPDMGPCAVHQIITDLEQEFAPRVQDRGLTLSIQAEEAWLGVHGLYLERMLRNLLDNAIRFTDQGNVELIGVRDGSAYRIDIRDTGIGIDVADHERVFEEFYQVNNPNRDRDRGTGLGLALVRRMANQMGVDLQMESALGEGTQFSLTLPLADQHDVVIGPDEDQESLEPLLTGKLVLVLEDDLLARDAMMRFLRGEGARVHLAQDKASVAEACAEHRFDLVIADDMLSDSRGSDLLDQMRRAGQHCPAFYLTGNVRPERLQELAATGLPVVRKPVSPGELRQAIRSVMPDHQAKAA